ncbi:MAG: hypothetical protein R2741_11675 [Methanolobus sp.]
MGVDIIQRIDFIGPSAAGKTTLLKQMLLEKKDSRKWVTPQEARIEIAKQQKYTLIKDSFPSFIFSNIYFLGKKNPHFLEAALEKLLTDKYAKEFANHASDYNCLFEMLLDSWYVQKKYRRPYDKIRFIRFYESILFKDVALLDNFEYKGVVICDDGIVHNNTGMDSSDAHQKLLCLSPEERKKIIPDGVIYCKVPLEENIVRRKRRIASGNMTMHEQNISDDELMQLSKKALENVACKVKLLQDLDVPLLEIDMTKSYDENIPLINSFIDRTSDRISVEPVYRSSKTKERYNLINELRSYLFYLMEGLIGLIVIYAFSLQALF